MAADYVTEKTNTGAVPTVRPLAILHPTVGAASSGKEVTDPIFIWDFVAGDVLDQIVDWIYGEAMGFLGNFFAVMGNMGAELFEMSWVQSIVLFFSYLGWALYVVGLVVRFRISIFRPIALI